MIIEMQISHKIYCLSGYTELARFSKNEPTSPQKINE